jgi:phenylpropionate dioxygenase-like ring-hydroxylating dioxygenase large terminal subunit
MNPTQATALREAIARQRPGWSLEQPFYTSAEIYEFERRGWLAEQWYVLGHCSEIPEPGSFMVRSLLGESLIIVRDTEGVVRGFYNVCRHRGSRICDHDGRGISLVCPYHAWSYRLDGSVRSAPAISEDIDLGQLGLHAVPVREIGGVIVGSLKGDPHTLDAVAREAEPLLRYHGIPQARIAARRSYPTYGNWKLVMENFAECYHCLPSHPEYCSVMKHVDVVARQATPEAAAAWQKDVDRWFREEADPDSPAQLRQPDYTLARPMYGISRAPIGGGRKTQSQDGEPVAPLMGQQRRYDGGTGGFSLRPFVSVIMPNDYAMVFQFLPSGPEKTDVIISWLVNGSARESEVDVERMVWMWDVTTAQDKLIIERNAEGVRSLAYVPGPYSAALEPGPIALVSRYLHELSERCSGAVARD